MTTKVYRIFDIEVDKATYDKYIDRSYDIGDGSIRDLRGVQLWATGKELGEHFPELAANARRIVAQITEEITGKEKKTMNTPKKSVEFIAALEELYNNSRAAYTAAEKSLTAASAHMDRCEEAKLKKPGDPLVCAKYDVARGDYLIAQDNFRKAIRKVQDAHYLEVKELRSKFAAFLDERYAANPDALDTGTMTLLNSGICSPAELLKLAERHANNPTMLRMVSAQAEKIRDRRNQIGSDYKLCTQVAMMASTAKNGDRELAVFDSAVGACERGLQVDAHTAGRMHNHITGWFSDFKTQIENLPYAPEV